MTLKSYEIPKRLIYEAWLQVRANRGASGIDAETIEQFETNLGDNLYKVWNRMSSGSYFPPPVRAVPIPKKSGGTRMLGVPTVADRVAQTAVKMWLEPRLDPKFHDDSYGYRPGKSALDAIAVTQRRCWENDWVVEFDIRGLFDNLDHELLMRALRKHCQEKWILLYVERWLKAPMQTAEGQILERDKGTPQGGVVSPILANLFLHYAFDAWVSRNLPDIRFARYADDAVMHCRTKRQAEYVLARIRTRFQECKLELHPDKTRVVYCKDGRRKRKHSDIQFTFLGYTFRPREVKTKEGNFFLGFNPEVSRDALKAMRQTIRGWHIQLKHDSSIDELAAWVNPVLNGWLQYYGRFRRSGLDPIWDHMNQFLKRWLMRKYKWLDRRITEASEELRRLMKTKPQLFVHWSLRVTA